MRHFRAGDWLRLLWECPVWLLRRPAQFFGLLGLLVPWHYRALINWAENVLGLACALRFAREFVSKGYEATHATWATAPGMASYALGVLTGLPYTLEAHAYDVFRDGGDAHLLRKLASAQRVRSSTEATARELRQRMERAGIVTPVICVRRGLESVPRALPERGLPGPLLRVLSVGRLIEKKGYLEQLEIFRAWHRSGLPFEASIVGEGPMRPMIEKRIAELGLGDEVRLLGKLDHDVVDCCYGSADLFLFCGQVSASGDRDGFPNVIGEAMAHGLPVFTTDVSGTTEGVVDGERGYVIDLSDPASCAAAIHARMQDVEAIRQVTAQALCWLQQEFDTEANVARLQGALWPES